MHEGVELAARLIDSGAALATLEAFVRESKKACSIREKEAA